MGKLGETIGGALGGLLTLLSIPLMLLNMFGGIVSGIWLMILGRWPQFGLGLVLLVVSSFILGLVLMPGMGVSTLGLVLVERKRTVGGALLLLLGSLWTYGIMYLWCGEVFLLMVQGSRGPGDIVPLALWGYANAVGPWSYMASQDRNATGSTIAVFAAQLGCAAMMVAAVFLHAELSVAGLSPYLFPFIVLGALFQTAIMIAVAVSATSQALGEKKAARVAATFD